MLDYSNPSYERTYQLLSDIKNSGMDTVILLAMGYLQRDNCQVANYRLINYLHEDNQALVNFLKVSQELNLNIYLGTAAHDESCFSIRGTDYQAINQKHADVTLELAQSLKDYYLSQGWSWDNGNVKGFYINDEMDIEETKSALLLSHYTLLSQRLKSSYPNKKIFISPWITERSTYDSASRAFNLIYSQTSIDIIAPQDSLGSGLTTSFSADKEHFRALADVTARYPGRTAWANIESFTKNTPGKSPSFIPSNILKLSTQIETVNPYVEKHITWIFQHTLNIAPSFDSNPSWTSQYTPELAIKRFQLRSDYQNWLHSPNTKITSVFTYGTNLVIKGDSLKNSSNRTYLTIHYLDNSGALKKHSRISPVFEEDKQTVYLPLEALPSFSINQPYALSLSPLSYLSPPSSPTTPPTSPPATSIPTALPTLVPSPTSLPTQLPSSTPRPTNIPPSSTPIPTSLPASSTPRPTLEPTSFQASPLLTQVPNTCTPCSNSLLKSKGDANCDGSIDVIDRSIWSSEILIDAGTLTKKSTWRADFNCDGYLNVIDRTIWSTNFSI